MTEKINSEQAISVVKRCLADNIRVLGVDGFIQKGDRYVANLDMIIDLSSPYRSIYLAAQEAVAFIYQHAGSDVLFEVCTE